MNTFAAGSVIRTRNRLWRVDGQPEDDVLVASTIDGGEAQRLKLYVPFEDIEPGQLEPPSTEVVGHIQAQDLLLRAYRLSLLHGTAPLLSLQRSRVIPKDYQLVPVVMSLEMQRLGEPHVRMLLADDVGLGKTIEAGLIATELLSRQMATRMLVIVPASLREQWREALDTFFHLPARIISTRHRRQMERELPAGANPWETYRFLITSVDYAKQAAIKNQILEQEWDIVIVDEAHKVSKPHQSGPDQSVSMDRWELAQALAESERVRHLMLLTATPHNGYTDCFASLLRMLDVGAVKGPPHAPQIVRSVAKQHVCQRRREDVEAWFQDAPDKSPFPSRDQDEVVVPPTSFEIDAIRAVEDYGEQVLRQAETARVQLRTLAHWTVLHLHKRALSSPEALRCSLRNRRERLEQKLAHALSSVEGEAVAETDDTPISPDVARANVLDEDTGERLTGEEAGRRTERLVYGSARQIEAELNHLEEVLYKAKRITASRDAKLRELLRVVLKERLRVDPKVVIFTRYVDTMTYLEERIGSDSRYDDVTVLTIYGGLSEQRRREIFHAFERATKAVLVATDAISEGINLQHAAAQVIHYELPWNPNRLEQRNGRVDRFGQRKPVVTIRTMVMDETLDAAILKVLVEKAARIRSDYGFSPPYFGDETTILDLMKQHDVRLGPKQLSFLDSGSPSFLDVAQEQAHDPFDEETLERIKGDSFYGQTHVSLPEIEQRLEETAETVGSPEQVRAFVFSGLSRFGCSVTENADGSYRIGLTEPALQTASVGDVIERATFDPEWALDDPDVTLLDLGHPLVRRLIEEVKQNAFRVDDAVGASAPLHYGRTAYVVTPDVDEVTAVFHLLARYVVNTDPTSIVEELLPVAVPVYGGRDLTGLADLSGLLDPEPSGQTRTEGEVQEALREALAIFDLGNLLEGAVEERREELVAERQRMQRPVRSGRPDRSSSQPAEWLEGIDDLAPGSFDMLTVTVLFPV